MGISRRIIQRCLSESHSEHFPIIPLLSPAAMLHESYMRHKNEQLPGRQKRQSAYPKPLTYSIRPVNPLHSRTNIPQGQRFQIPLSPCSTIFLPMKPNPPFPAIPVPPMMYFRSFGMIRFSLRLSLIQMSMLQKCGDRYRLPGIVAFDNGSQLR